MTSKTTHGGARDGAGRPPKEEGRVPKQLRVLPDTLKKIEEEAKRLKISQAAVVDGWAHLFAKKKQS